MAGVEDDDGDADAFRAPLPPADRVWRHPAEVAAEAGSVDRARRRRRRRGRAVFFAASALSGAGVVVLALAAIGEFSDGGRGAVAVATSVPTIKLIAPPTVPFDDAAQAEATMAAVTRIRADGPDGARHATGVLLPDDGYLLTTASAVAGATSITVWLDNGVQVPGTVVGSDEANDVAVVLVAGKGLPGAALGTARGLHPGDAAVLVDASRRGGQRARLTRSSVVATERRVEMHDHVMHGMVQVDADDEQDVTGVLLGSDGTVLGLVTGSVDGGYVTTIDWAMRIAADLMADGEVHHAWLGIEGTDLRPADAEDYAATHGALVVAVGGPAEAAGLEADDVIIGVDDADVRSMSDLVLAVRPHWPGDEIRLRYLRNGTEWTCTATLAAPEASTTALVTAAE